ncbi:MAG: glycosyltransferase [Firmicutes bacterium]|nr:glycosyltransferase [Bacillota bacterium]
MISVCMIIKNEEKFLERCLREVKKTGWEIVAVDTGSTDKSVEIAKKYTDKVYFFEWVNDFSAARNFSSEKAENDIVLMIDADEFITGFDKKKVEEQISKNKGKVGCIYRKNSYMQNGEMMSEIESISRIYDRRLYEFKGKIHEQVERKDGKKKEFYDVEIYTDHIGYDENEIDKAKKAERNIKMLLKEIEDNGDDPYMYYQLGKSCYMIKEYEKALEYFAKGISMTPDPQLEYVQNMVECYGYTLINCEEYEAAMQIIDMYDIFAKSADYMFLAGLVLMNNGKLKEAIEEFEKAKKCKKYRGVGVNSYLADYNIGVIYECMGNIKKAEKHYKLCGDYKRAEEGLKRIKRLL